MQTPGIDLRKLARAAAPIVLGWLAGVLFFATCYCLRTDWALASDCFLLLMMTGGAACALQFRQINIRRDEQATGLDRAPQR